MIELLEKYIALWVVVGLAILGMIFTFALQLIWPKEKRGETPTGAVFKKVVSDPPSLIALFLTAAITLLVLVGEPVPAVVQDAFFLAIGFYFGERARTKKRQSVDEADEDL